MSATAKYFATMLAYLASFGGAANQNLVSEDQRLKDDQAGDASGSSFGHMHSDKIWALCAALDEEGQIHNVPILCMTHDIGIMLGFQIGTVKEIDIGATGDCVGHSSRECPVTESSPNIVSSKNHKYGIWLRASSPQRDWFYNQVVLWEPRQKKIQRKGIIGGIPGRLTAGIIPTKGVPLILRVRLWKVRNFLQREKRNSHGESISSKGGETPQKRGYDVTKPLIKERVHEKDNFMIHGLDSMINKANGIT
ncbi:hypothetical protein JRO89_XS08G0037200 [Xanthoceras sorbifolium]|uniref:Uncharacterized protein n=1 Tax=Xanthoceras sorbifolium TaxID=99658 RepID=A0ABQ8HNJ9_9ROSI|nr:hypothetical protein JRO89_XS08G0037200 [Xanthoceras sorbifolium]